MREHIEEKLLTDQQRQSLQLLRDTDLRAIVNNALRERGIPLEVYQIQMAAGPVLKDHLEMKLKDDEWPPPGGCYCWTNGAGYCC
jgi:hypothetical protein